MIDLVPRAQRDFARQVVQTLRDAGHETYWAGGCVRDMLLEREPKDYDVASDARPERIREVFGRRRTIPVGAAFGVITVLGPPGAGGIEVATFREDAQYSDGRRPDAVTFSSAERDAQRRDFTINGLFYDPLKERVIDFVGGREDIRRRVVRAIGDPAERFEEDKLRLMRAVRFSALFEFALDESTSVALAGMAEEILVVSPERIAAELQRMLVSEQRRRAVELLIETGLARAVLPEVGGETDPTVTLAELEAISASEATFPLAFACWIYRSVDAAGAETIGRRLRLSNEQRERIVWIVEHHAGLNQAERGRWSRIQPVLVHPGADELVALAEARARVRGNGLQHIAYCRLKRSLPAAVLDPPELLRGNDLIEHGIRPGPRFRSLIEAVRRSQLDGEIATQRDALALVTRLMRDP